MKKIMMMLMIMATFMFVVSGTSFALGIGTKGVSVDGSSGVSIGNYDGIQCSVAAGVQGTGANISIAKVNVRGVSTGTTANGSVVTIGAYAGKVGKVAGVGYYNANTNGRCSAYQPGVGMSGNYNSHSTVVVGGGI